VNNSILKYVESFHDSPLERAGTIHPSSLSCHRKAVYQHKGVEPDREYTEEELRVFASGHMTEQFVIEGWRRSGVLIAHNVPVRAHYDGVSVEGEIDAILQVDGGWSIHDVKSMKSYAFRYNSHPYEHHIVQIGCYEWMVQEMIAAGKMRSFSVPEALIKFGPQQTSCLFYVGRDNLQEEPVQVGDGAVHQALMQLSIVVGAIKTDTTPDRPFETPEDHPWLCSKCVQRGYRKKNGTYSPGKEPIYEPNCIYFKHCWGVMPKQWSFWTEEHGES